MERRLFLTGLLGVAGTAGIAAVLPRQALAAVPMGPTPQSNSVLPNLNAPAEDPIEPEEPGELGELDEGVELAHYPGRRRRRWVRRWRRRCRRHFHNGYWHRHCRRYPHFVSIWISL